MSVTFEPIGKVIVEKGRFFIQLDRAYWDGVTGLEEYSHIQVIWYFHLYDSPESRNYMVMDKPYKNGPDKVGVFASRSPVRPGPIAITPCPLLSVDGERCRLEVAYIDAEDGTPVLDLKPYEPSVDRVVTARMPGWASHWPDCYEKSGDFDWEKEFNFPE